MKVPILPNEIWYHIMAMSLHIGPRHKLIHHRPHYSQVGCKRKIGTFYFNIKYQPVITEMEIARVYNADWSKWLREIAAFL